MPRAWSICSSPAALRPVPIATTQTIAASRPARKPSVGVIANSSPATSTPANVQASIATTARRLRRPVTACSRLESASPERPAGGASDKVSLDITSSLVRRARRVVLLVLVVAPALVLLAQLAADRLVGVLGLAARARLAHRF